MSESLYLPYIISYVIVGLPRPTTGGTTSAQPPVFKCFTSNFLTTAAKARLLRLLSSSKDMLRSYSEMNVSNTPKSSRRDRMTSTTLWLSSLDKCRELTVRGERQGGMYSALLSSNKGQYLFNVYSIPMGRYILVLFQCFCSNTILSRLFRYMPLMSRLKQGILLTRTPQQDLLLKYMHAFSTFYDPCSYLKLNEEKQIQV